eukprot:6150441-Alexandrium_andersonii.AAC.1
MAVARAGVRPFQAVGPEDLEGLRRLNSGSLAHPAKRHVRLAGVALELLTEPEHSRVRALAREDGLQGPG